MKFVFITLILLSFNFSLAEASQAQEYECHVVWGPRYGGVKCQEEFKYILFYNQERAEACRDHLNNKDENSEACPEENKLANLIET